MMFAMRIIGRPFIIPLVFIALLPIEQQYAHAEENTPVQSQINEAPIKNSVPADVRPADECRKAAEQGDATAQMNLARSYFYGVGAEKDLKEAIKWFRKAAEQGNADAQLALAALYLSDGVNKNKKESIIWLRKAADQGNVQAEYFMGAEYHNGINVEKDDIEAAKWFRRAAEQGNARAQSVLGSFYMNGDGVEKSEREGVKWLRKSADQSDADAQLNLGVCYYNGTGVERNYNKAVALFHQSANQGNEKAKENLQTYYERAGKTAAQDNDAGKKIKSICEPAQSGLSTCLALVVNTYKPITMTLINSRRIRKYADDVNGLRMCAEAAEKINVHEHDDPKYFVHSGCNTEIYEDGVYSHTDAN